MSAHQGGSHKLESEKGRHRSVDPFPPSGHSVCIESDSSVKNASRVTQNLNLPVERQITLLTPGR